MLSDAGTLPEARTLASSSVNVDYSRCEGAYCAICVDVAVGEAVRIVRSGPPVAVAGECVVGSARAVDAAKWLVCASKDPKLVALHPGDETPIEDWCSSTSSPIPAVAITLYLAPTRRVHVTWSAADVLDDPVVGGSGLPQPGHAEFAMADGDDAVIVQCPVVASFDWRVESVK